MACYPVSRVPYLPPEVVALLLALGAFCGIVMMFGIRIAMRGDLEPMSRSGRRLLAVFLLVAALGAYALYRLFRATL